MNSGYDKEFLKDYNDQVSLGNVAGVQSVNKFGRASNAASGVLTDIWDRANATNNQAIWISPTQARVHNIASTSTSDDGDPAGVGAQTIQIWGLTDWDTPEITETVIMNGTTDVPTSSAYVIIHRMKVITNGATNVNVGIITATAVTDGTVTSQINVGDGQTHTSIYGVPSTQKLLIARLYGNINKSGGATGKADVSLRVNEHPDTQLVGFRGIHTFGLMTSGTSALTINYEARKKIIGPAIVRIQTSPTATLDMSAGFDAHLYNN